jgi:hypothetical protein
VQKVTIQVLVSFLQWQGNCICGEEDSATTETYLSLVQQPWVLIFVKSLLVGGTVLLFQVPLSLSLSLSSLRMFE